MTRQSLRLVVGAAVLSVVSLSAHAAERGGVSLAGRFGTLGFGLEAATSVSPQLNLRGGLNLLNYTYGPGFDSDLSYRGASSNVHFDTSLHLKSAQFLADFYALGEGFHLSGGLVYNRNQVRAESSPQQAITINDQVYQVDQLGTLIGTGRLGKRWAPYLGLGFGHPAGGDQRVTVVFDLGVVFQGSPTLALTTTGAVSNVPGLQDDLDVAAEKVNREHLDKNYLRYYPVLSLGVAVRVF